MVGEEYLFNCPFCKHHKPKLSINLDKGAKCWVCNWASPRIFRIIKRLGNRQQKDEWRELEGTLDINEFSEELFEDKKEEKQTGNFVKTRKISRNEPCSCGSGKKYKHCHGKVA